MIYGPCFRSCGAYSVVLDNGPPKTYNASLSYVPDPTQFSQNCLRYYAGGLNSTKQHNVTLINAQQGRLTAVSAFQVVQISGGTPFGQSNGSGQNIGAIVGLVLGLLAALAIMGVCGFFYWRKRRWGGRGLGRGRLRPFSFAGSDPVKVTPFQAGPRTELNQFGRSASASVTSLTPFNTTDLGHPPGLAYSDRDRLLPGTLRSGSTTLPNAPTDPTSIQTGNLFMTPIHREKGSIRAQNTPQLSTIPPATTAAQQPSYAPADAPSSEPVDLSQLSSDVNRILLTLNQIQNQSAQQQQSATPAIPQEETPPTYSER